MKQIGFGATKEGKEITKYVLTNKNGMEVSVIDLGAVIVSVKLKDKNGDVKDVVLGYDTAEEYQEHDSYFGAFVGRNANRISDARICLDGVEYVLEANDNGVNNLHSGKNGLSAFVWSVEEIKGDNEITFTVVSKDMEQDFPGNMTVKVTYTLTDENELVMAYEAVTDKLTVANFTNHSYFNLDGHESGNIENQELELMASYYTPVIDSKAIPTGAIEDVTGTPMDFRKMKKIGKDIRADFKQLEYVNGYDHNYAIDGADGTMKLAAKAKAAETGICMDVYTDCVGIQLYAGNFIGNQKGKDGASYADRQGFCLETQYFPNAINEENFKSPLLAPGEICRTTTKYCFSVEK